MIKLTKMNRDSFWLNTELIESLEATPDTIITLVTGKKLMVEESVESVLDAITKSRARLFNMAREYERYQNRER